MCLALPGCVVSLKEHDQLSRVGWVDFGGVQEEVNLSLVPSAKPGDYVVVHVGFAISKVDPQAARQTLKDLQSLLETDGIKQESANETSE